MQSCSQSASRAHSAWLGSHPKKALLPAPRLPLEAEQQALGALGPEHAQNYRGAESRDLT